MRAPGRVNLIGEYTDFNLGFVLPAAIDREVRIAFVPTDDRRVVLHRSDSGERGEFELDRLPARAGTWLDYAVGVAWALTEAGHELGGLRGVIGSNLPTGAGLSSSAAIELAIAHAILVEPAGSRRLLEQLDRDVAQGSDPRVVLGEPGDRRIALGAPDVVGRARQLAGLATVAYDEGDPLKRQPDRTPVERAAI